MSHSFIFDLKALMAFSPTDCKPYLVGALCIGGKNQISVSLPGVDPARQLFPLKDGDVDIYCIKCPPRRLQSTIPATANVPFSDGDDPVSARLERRPAWL